MQIRDKQNRDKQGLPVLRKCRNLVLAAMRNLKLNWYFLIENIFVSSGDSSKESFCLGAHISTSSTWV